MGHHILGNLMHRLTELLFIHNYAEQMYLVFAPTAQYLLWEISHHMFWKTPFYSET